MAKKTKQKFFSERGVAMVVEVITASVAFLAIATSIYFVVQNHHKTTTVTPVTSSTTPAASTTPKTQSYAVYIKSTVGLRLRSSKDDSSTANVIATMPFNAQVTVDDDTDSTWDHGTYSGKTGYFSKSLVVKNEADVTADWKTFTSNYEKVSFKYPSEWAFKSGPGVNVGIGASITSSHGLILGYMDEIDGLGGACDASVDPHIVFTKVEKLPNANALKDLYLVETSDSVGLIDATEAPKVGDTGACLMYYTFSSKIHSNQDLAFAETIQPSRIAVARPSKEVIDLPVAEKILESFHYNQ